MFHFLSELSGAGRVLALIVVAAIAHIAVLGVRAGGVRLTQTTGKRSFAKARSLASLVSSVLIFAIYFGVLGLILSEFGVSLTAYLASASILGLAIGFGSQGLVQDVVTGVTVIFSDLFDIGDMVEISGQTGVVRHIGMRFTALSNAMGAEVYIPNRSIANVINYPRGYVRCLVDVSLSTDAAKADRMVALVRDIAASVPEQFPGILRSAPAEEGQFTTRAGRVYLRLKFRIWPGRGGPIEASFRQELVQSLKQIEPEYQDWMVAITYEVEGPKSPRPGKARRLA